MKILIVSNTVYGGAGKACLRLYEAMRKRGEDVKLLHLEGRQSNDPNIVSFYPKTRDLFLRQMRSTPSRILRHMILGDTNREYRLPSSIHRLEEHPLIEWADIINLHWVPDFVDYCRFFARVRDKPVVWTMHDMLPFTGGFHYETEIAERKRKRNVERSIQRKKTSALIDANVSIVAPSDWLLGISKREPTFNASLHRHIFNGLPLKVYRPIDRLVAREIMGLPGDCKIVLFVADGVGSVRKGGKHLLDALQKLEREDLLLVSVGKGCMEIGGKVEYRHLGSFSDEISMVLAYASSDLVVVPSVEDNSPNIIIESFACGRPVVAFDVGGIGELVCDPSLGVLVDEIGPQALAEGINTALYSEFESDPIRENAETRFADEILAENYINLFSHISA